MDTTYTHWLTNHTHGHPLSLSRSRPKKQFELSGKANHFVSLWLFPPSFFHQQLVHGPSVTVVSQTHCQSGRIRFTVPFSIFQTKKRHNHPNNKQQVHQELLLLFTVTSLPPDHTIEVIVLLLQHPVNAFPFLTKKKPKMSKDNRNNLPSTAAGPATAVGPAAAAAAGAQAAPGMINLQHQQQQQQHLQQMFQQQQQAAWLGGAAAMSLPHHPIYQQAGQYFQQPQPQPQQQRQVPLRMDIPPPGRIHAPPPGTTAPGYATAAGHASANRYNTTNNKRNTSGQAGSKSTTTSSSSAATTTTTKRSKPSTSLSTTAVVPEFLQETQRQGGSLKRTRDPSLPKQRRKRYSKDEKKQIMDELYSNPTGLNGPPVRLADVAERFGLPEG